MIYYILGVICYLVIALFIIDLKKIRHLNQAVFLVAISALSWIALFMLIISYISKENENI